MLSLGVLDTSILAAYIIVLASIGWWAARRTAKTTEDYFLANRSVPWLITVASTVTTLISAITFIGAPGEGFSGDYRYLMANGGDIAATIFISSAFLPHFQKMRVTSIYEAVTQRLGPSMRTVCSAYFLVTRTIASTVRIVAIAKVVEVVTGGALSYPSCVLVVVGVVLAYTTMGGGRAIAWTDLLQFSLLMTGALASIVYIVHQVPGGIPTIINIGKHAVRPDGTIYNKFNFLELLKPENLWLLLFMVIWGFFNSSAAYGTDQDLMQRLLACKDPRKARWSLVAWGLGGIPLVFLFLSIGASLYAYSQFHPELIAGMKDNDHIFPRFILTVMPHGLRGLLLAAVASAAMGSADSALASLSTAFTVDFYKPFWGKDADDAQCVKVSRISFVGFGVLFILFALIMHRLDNLLWLAFRMVAFTYGPLLGVFAVALLTEWRVPTRKLIVLMISLTCLFLTLAMAAWWMTAHGSTSVFWTQLHQTYWRLYVVLGALAVPAGAYIMREESL